MKRFRFNRLTAAAPRAVGRFRFALGFVLGALVFGAIGASAASLEKPITATYRDVKIYLNEQFITPRDANGKIVEPFIADGTTYLPVRAVAGALGLEVGWVESTSSVYLGSQPVTVTPTPTAPPTSTPTPTASPTPTATPAPTPGAEIPGGTAVDYSLAANPAIFSGTFYTRAYYNTQRQTVLDVGTNINWGTNAPSSTAAIATADQFAESLNGLSDTEKITKINNFLCAHMEYKSGSTFNSNDFWTGTAYGVCEQYARLARYLCWRAGIPCVYITGPVTGNSVPGYHAWNEVYVDGKWQYYEPTFSDTLGRIQFGTIDKKYTYTDKNPELTLFTKEIYVPGSTLQ